MQLLLNSPVIVGALTVLSGIISVASKKPESTKRAEEDAKREKYDNEHKEILDISRNLDRHINNSKEPFRAQINAKLDMMSTMIEASLESQKSINTNIRMIDNRVSAVEEAIDELKDGKAGE